MQTNVRQAILGSITGLVILNAVLFTSFLAQIEPHPATNLGPLGGAGPFIGTTIAVSAITLLFAYWRHRIAYGLGAVVVIQNLITFGPHKLLGEAAPLVYPAVVTGSLLTVALLVAVITGVRTDPEQSESRQPDASPSEGV